MKEVGLKMKFIPRSNLSIAAQFELHDILDEKVQKGKMKKLDENDSFFVYTKIKKKDRTNMEIFKLAFEDEKFYKMIISNAIVTVE